MTLKEIAHLVKAYEPSLRRELAQGRAGLFKFSDNEYKVVGQLALGTRLEGAEPVYIFANCADLDAFLNFCIDLD